MLLCGMAGGTFEMSLLAAAGAPVSDLKSESVIRNDLRKCGSAQHGHSTSTMDYVTCC